MQGQRATNKAGQPQLEALTGLRILAALHVVAFHYAVPAAVASGPAALERFLRMGFIGVSLFFVLSGFVLAYNYAGEDGGLRGARRPFWVARLSRIYPLFLLALVLQAPVYVAQTVEHSGLRSGLLRAAITAVPALVMLQAWTPFTTAAWNGPGWSLSAEAFFYLAFPWVVARVRCATRGQLAVAGAACFLAANAAPLALFVASRATRLEATSVHMLGASLDGLQLAQRTVGFNPLLRLPEFVFGVCLGKYFLATRSAPRRDGGAALAAGSMVALAAIFCAAGALPDARFLLQNGACLPLFGALVLGLAQGGGRLGRALSTKAMLRLGEASYAVYILQEPVWSLFSLALPPAVRAARAPGWPAFLALVVVLVAVSFLAHRFVEVPARDWLKRSLSPARPRSSPRLASSGAP